jgi:alkanesulfonate monooxygenase SsuD/methylene tetrahydromethanopterin reductase-like flavin-dependent oxidoreductase (luciferase family)
MGGDFAHRWSQTREAILAMKELWTREAAEYHGTYYDFPPVHSFPKPAQRPHPPVFLGGTARHAFKRVVEWGDGWMPNRISADDIRRGRAALDELAEHAGRDPRSIEVLAFGFGGQFRSREAIQELEDAGANRVTIWLNQTDGQAALTEMDEIARQVLP